MSLAASVIIGSVRGIIQETTPKTWNDTTHFLPWLNEAINQLVLRLPDDCLPSQATLDDSFDMSGGSQTLPTDFLRYKGLLGDWTSGDRMARLIDVAELETMRAYTGTAPTTESPICYIYGGKIYCEPSAGPASGDLYYIASHTQIASTATAIPLSDPLASLCTEFLAARAFSRVREMDQVGIHMQTWERSIAEIWSQNKRMHQVEEREKAKR